FWVLRSSGHQHLLQLKSARACWKAGAHDCKAYWRKRPCPSIHGTALMKAFHLKADVHEKHASKEFGLMVGIHLNKPLPPHSQMKAGC
ncbi:hypothetical protein XENOCAPTIV_008279, partial [Xenoophorus captivus]